MEKGIRWKIAQQLELRWWNRYLKGKDKESYLKWKSEYWNNLNAQLEPELQLDQSLNILDAGCGPAGMFIVLDEHQVDAVDPLLNSYESDIAHFDSKDYPFTQFISEGLEEFQPAKTYDLVYCLNAINHVRNLELAMDNLWSTVKPGGTLAFSIDAHNYSLFKTIFRLLPGDLLHPQQFDEEEYTQMLRKRGAKILKRVGLKKEFFFEHVLLLAKKLDS